MMDGLWQMTLRNGVTRPAWLFPFITTQKLQVVLFRLKLMA